MNKNLKIFLGITYLSILLIFLYLIFLNIEIKRLNDFYYYKELQSNLDIFLSGRILINIVYFSLFSILWVSLLGFGAPLLIISGIIFGKWLGTIVSVISISLGALVLYTIGNFFLGN